MFYSHEILQRRGGKFGVVWLAATDPKLLTRRDYACVNVMKSCSDIIEYILGRIKALQEGSKKPRLSLYLSSKLMYGVAFVHKKQHIYLLEDVRLLQERLHFLNISHTESIDLLPAKPSAVTFDDPRFCLVDLDFGRMEPLLISPSFPSYEYFMVASPHSSEELIISPDSLEEKRIEDEQAHTVHPSHITLLEPVITPKLETVAEEMISEGPDLPPLDLDDIEIPMPSLFPSPPPLTIPAVPPVALPREEPETHVPTDLKTTETVEKTPVTFALPIEHKRPEKALPSAPDITPAPVVPMASVTEDQKRRRGQKRRIESHSDFQLEEIESTSRPKRFRRQLNLFDEEISLSREDLRTMIATANQRLTVPFELPSLKIPVNKLFSQPGSRIKSKVLLKFWSNLRTVSEPRDAAPPGAYTIYQESSPSSIDTESALREEASAKIVPKEISHEEMEISTEVERLRERSQADSLSLVTPLSLKDTTFLGEPLDVSETFPSVSGTLAVIEEVSPHIGAIIEEIEPPAADITEDVMEPLPPLIVEPECMVSPIRTPPPLSPEALPCPSPSQEKMLQMLAAVFSVSPTPGLTTFKALIPPALYSRKFASNSLYQLLNLNQLGVIYLQQTEPYDTIFISRGKNF